MTSRRMRSGDMLLGAARIEAEAIRDAKAEGQPSPSRSSTMAVALVDQARTKLGAECLARGFKSFAAGAASGERKVGQNGACRSGTRPH
jgi:hypothetical protein